MWFVYPSASSSDSDNLVFTRSWDFDGVVSGVGRKWKRSDSSRLRAVSIFSVIRRAKRDTRKWPRAQPRFARLAASPLPRTCIALTKSEEKERLLAVYDSSDSDSVALTTLLTTLIFDFHKVINALTTQLTTPTPTPSLVKTSRRNHVLFTWRQPRKTERKVRKHSSISGALYMFFRFSRFIYSKALWYTRMFSIVLSLCIRCNYFCKPAHLTFERGFVFSSKREWSRCSSFLVSEKLRVESAFA